jgi:hypothetical protein
MRGCVMLKYINLYVCRACTMCVYVCVCVCVCVCVSARACSGACTCLEQPDRKCYLHGNYYLHRREEARALGKCVSSVKCVYSVQH